MLASIPGIPIIVSIVFVSLGGLAFLLACLPQPSRGRTLALIGTASCVFVGVFGFFHGPPETTPTSTTLSVPSSPDPGASAHNSSRTTPSAAEPDAASVERRLVRGTVREQLEDRGLVLEALKLESDPSPSGGYTAHFLLKAKDGYKIPFRTAILQGIENGHAVITANSAYQLDYIEKAAQLAKPKEAANDVFLGKDNVDHPLDLGLPANSLTGFYSQVVITVQRPGEEETSFFIDRFDEQLREAAGHIEYFFPHDYTPYVPSEGWRRQDSGSSATAPTKTPLQLQAPPAPRLAAAQGNETGDGDRITQSQLGFIEKIVTASIATEYHYGDKYGALPSSATAYINGDEAHLLGRAEVIDYPIAKGPNGNRLAGVIVVETQLDHAGAVIYRAEVRFDERGARISEKRISGLKMYSLFKEWSPLAR
jgi:hypothetical protein